MRDDDNDSMNNDGRNGRDRRGGGGGRKPSFRKKRFVSSVPKTLLPITRILICCDAT